MGALGDATSIAAEEASAEVWDVVGVKAEAGEEGEVVGLRRVVSLLSLVAVFARFGVAIATLGAAAATAPPGDRVDVGASVEVDDGRRDLATPDGSILDLAAADLDDGPGGASEAAAAEALRAADSLRLERVARRSVLLAAAAAADDALDGVDGPVPVDELLDDVRDLVFGLVGPEEHSVGEPAELAPREGFDVVDVAEADGDEQVALSRQPDAPALLPRP